MAKTPEERNGSSQFISLVVHRPRDDLILVQRAAGRAGAGTTLSALGFSVRF
jgi:hypothetical protein